jgi:lipid-A-disaccharide synthase
VSATESVGTFALVAGEASGDLLGAGLIAALKERFPAARFVGIGGPRMIAAGLEAWYPAERLAVMGIVEVLPRLFELLRLRATLRRRIIELKPDVFIGIDAPDFNLGLEQRLKTAGIRTVHYVSPSVWAWREQRAQKLGRSADLVLCLFPLEPPIYARHGVAARFVGHPLADAFPPTSERAPARAALGLREDAPVLALLPGSRLGEISRLGAVFLDAADRAAAEIPALQVVIPAANAQCRRALEDLLADPRFAGFKLLDGHAHEALLAADVVLLASGTAALEAMLAKRPMVVGYKVAPWTYRLVRWLKLMRTTRYSLPNILANRDLVPELMQDACTPAALAQAVLELFRAPEQRAALVQEFEGLHESLRGPGDASHAAAAAVAELAASTPSQRSGTH